MTTQRLTVAELAALPDGAVIIARDGSAWQCNDGYWLGAGDDQPLSAPELVQHLRPLSLIYDPTIGAQVKGQLALPKMPAAIARQVRP